MNDALNPYVLILVGCGQMGSAIVRRVIEQEAIAPTELICVDADLERQDQLATELSAQQGLGQVHAHLNARRIFLIAVKPKHVQGVLEGIHLTERDHVVSVAAGVTLEMLRMWAGNLPSLVRTMPNTPCLVGEGVTGVMLGVGADGKAVQSLFGSVGKVVLLQDESQFDPLTAISGSGPAYVFTIIEALADGGVLMGLDRQSARTLAMQTLIGATTLAMQSDVHTAELKDRVASPGGTTIAALAELERTGLRHALISAVRAAASKSQTMTQDLLERMRRNQARS